MNLPSGKFFKDYEEDPWGRTPFEHEDLKGLEALAGRGKDFLLHPKQIAQIAEKYGLPEVVRWEPREVSLPNTYKHSNRRN